MRSMRIVFSLVAVLALITPGARADEANCVGNPPRQTEDPLSPPCVPFYDGDNGGATYAGVTGDEITIALYNDLGVTGDMDLPWSSDDEAAGSQASAEQSNLVRTIKTQLRYFKRRSQTYGRTVHVIAKPSKGGISSPCPQRTADSYVVNREIGPFANITLGENLDCFAESMAHDFKTPTFLYGSDLPRNMMERYAPYMWSFLPDAQTETAYSGSYICRALAGRPARFATDPAIKMKTRTFGIIHPERDSPRGPAMFDLSQDLIHDVKKRCDITLVEKTFQGGGQTNAASIMKSFQDAGITTIACYCVTVPSEVTVPTMQSAATALAYFPEWFWDHASRMDKPMWERKYGNPAQASFGVSYFWREPDFAAQVPTRAFLSEEPSGNFNERFNFDIYYMFEQLFTAIQSAGPHLTPSTVRDGLFSTASVDRRSPFHPIGGYGPYDEHATGSYSFVDTAMAWWWDPTGIEPGGNPTSPGCERVAHNGKRFYAGQWPKNDEDLFSETAPCTAAPQHYNGVP